MTEKKIISMDYPHKKEGEWLVKTEDGEVYGKPFWWSLIPKGFFKKGDINFSKEFNQ